MHHKPYQTAIKTAKGHSLLELLVATTIASLLIAASVPGNQGMVQNNEKKVTLDGIQGQLNLARSHAIATGSPVIVCGSSTGDRCDGDWNAGIRVATPEPTSNPALDAGTTIHYASLPLNHGSLQFRSFPANQHQITFAPSGSLNRVSNGSFWYCPHQTSAQTQPQRTTLSRAGHVQVKQKESAATLRRACR